MSLHDVVVPDIGDFKDVMVAEIKVKPGDSIAVDDTVVVLETDKAVVDIPSPSAGQVRLVRVNVGDRVSEGFILLAIESAAAPAEAVPIPAAPQPLSVPPERVEEARVGPSTTNVVSFAPSQPATVTGPSERSTLLRAGPAVRRVARELGVDLHKLTGTGRNGRLVKEDVQAFVKASMTALTPARPAPSTALDLLPWPRVDFTKFGPVERAPLSKIRRISGANLTRNAIVIPHVTNFDEADITDLETFRLSLNKERQSGAKVTLLAFAIRAAVATLQKYPAFNSSLDGEEVILKRYYHIGFAVDTPDGLLVPNIKDADQKGVSTIAAEAAQIANDAREGRLKPADMQGTTFTISSLGGVGGVGFTPIINAPEVAILGLARAQTKPVWDGTEFKPRYIQPMSLSWDHRVVDGVASARFLGYLSSLLTDLRRAVL